MSKEHHFIVKFNEETGVWSWDTDTEEARFDNETIFNSETNEWSSGYLGDGEFDPAEEGLGEQLQHALYVMNLVNGKVRDGEPE
jgi:hypothetical protein